MTSRAAVVVRAVWLAAAFVALSLFLASIPALFSGALIDRRVQESGAWVSALYAASVAASTISVGVSLLLAALLIVRKPNDRMAVFVSFYLLAYGIALGGPLEALENYWRGSTALSLMIQTVLLGSPTFALFCLFPNGRFVPGWTRGLTFLYALLTIAMVLAAPPAELQAMSTLVAKAFNWLLGGLILTGVYAQVYRYRKVSTSAERQQSRSVVFGIALWLGLILAEGIPYYLALQLPAGTPRPWWTPIGNTAWFLTMSVLPLSLTIAVLRYRLFEIDLLIRRTLIYGMLTATLALVYFGSVLLLQQLLRQVTGHPQNDVVIVLSTLTIFVLFAPLRRRIQQAIDRRFYRRKYNAQQVLAAFGATARDEVNLQKLSEDLLAVANETMQPAAASLWLKKTSRNR